MKRILGHILMVLMIALTLSSMTNAADPLKVTLPDGRVAQLAKDGTLRFEQSQMGAAPLVKSAGTRINPKDGSRMIFVPAGTFLAGDEKFPVNLPAYYMAETEVTNAQYAGFLAERRPSQTELVSWITLNGSCFVLKAGTRYEAYGGKANWSWGCFAASPGNPRFA